MINQNNLRDQAKALLALGEINQSKLADAANLHRSQISKFINDGTNLSDESVEKLAAAIQSLQSQNSDPPIPNKIANELARKLRDDQLVLFVGAGLSHLCPFVSPRTTRLPMWSGLADAIAEKFREENLDPKDFGNTTDFFDYAMSLEGGAAKSRVQLAIREALDETYIYPSAAHNALAHLPWSEIWTTNYDTLLERATGKKTVNGENEFGLLREYHRAREGIVLHLHGTKQNPHTLGKDSYRNWEGNNPQVLAYIKGILLQKTILFVGYGLGDPNLDEALNWLRNARNGEVAHYALSWKVPPARLAQLIERDHIEAISFVDEAQFQKAFVQLACALTALQTPQKTITGTIDQDTKAPIATPISFVLKNAISNAFRSKWISSGVGNLVIDGPLHVNEIEIDRIFVEPSLAVRNRDSQSKPVAPTETETDSATDEKQTAAQKNQHSNDALEKERKAQDHEAVYESMRTLAKPALATIARERFLVILGEPGSGKSVLLRQAAREEVRAWAKAPAENVATPLPFYFRLNEWESAVDASSQAPESVLLDRLRRLIPSESPASQEETQWLTRPEAAVHWLLDGLDEVRDPAERRRLHVAVEALAQARPQDRFTVSARPSGYTMPFGSPWVETTLAPLDDAQVRSVLGKWQTITETTNDIGVDAKAVDTDLKRNTALKYLRRNPLILTLAVLFYRNSNRLPHDRWEFYTKADDSIRVKVARTRKQAGQSVDDHTTDWAKILGRLALSGMRGNQVRFSRAELENEYSRYLQYEKGTSFAETTKRVGEFIREAEDLVGVIGAYSPDEFGFIHLTFQEFHAAKALLSFSEEELDAVIAQEWDNPDWAETWALFVLGAKDSGRLQLLGKLIDGALNNLHPTIDAALYRPQLAAVRWCGLVGNLGYALPQWKSIEKWCLKQFVDAREGSLYHAFNQLIDVLATTQAGLPAQVTTALLVAIKDKEWRVRRAAAQALASVATTPQATTALLMAIKDEDWRVRYAATEALASVAATPQVTTALLLMIMDEDSDVRYAAVLALASVATTPQVTTALLLMIKDEASLVRRAAAQALASVAATPQVTTALLVAIKDEVSDVRDAAAQALAAVARQLRRAQ